MYFTFYRSLPVLQLIEPTDSKYNMVSDGVKRKLEVKNVSNKDEGLFKCVVQGKETAGKLYVARKSPVTSCASSRARRPPASSTSHVSRL